MAFLKSTIAAGFAAVTMLLLPGAPAEAKTKIVIGIGSPYYGGYYGGSYCYNRPYKCRPAPRPYYFKYAPTRYYYDYDYRYDYRRKHSAKLSCNAAAKIVDSSGFNHVSKRDCSGSVYSFNAKRKGKSYRVSVSAQTGRIVGTTRR